MSPTWLGESGGSGGMGMAITRQTFGVPVHAAWQSFSTGGVGAAGPTSTNVEPRPAVAGGVGGRPGQGTGWLVTLLTHWA